jgi:hypothetical protein
LQKSQGVLVHRQGVSLPDELLVDFIDLGLHLLGPFLVGFDQGGPAHFDIDEGLHRCRALL